MMVDASNAKKVDPTAQHDDAGPFQRSALPRIPTCFQRSLAWKSEYEAKIPGHSELGSTVAPHERKTVTEVHQRQDRRVSIVGFHRLHRDSERFAPRLVPIIQSQLRSHFARAQRQTKLRCTTVNFCKGRF